MNINNALNDTRPSHRSQNANPLVRENPFRGERGRSNDILEKANAIIEMSISQDRLEKMNQLRELDSLIQGLAGLNAEELQAGADFARNVHGEVKRALELLDNIEGNKYLTDQDRQLIYQEILQTFDEITELGEKLAKAQGRAAAVLLPILSVEGLGLSGMQSELKDAVENGIATHNERGMRVTLTAASERIYDVRSEIAGRQAALRGMNRPEDFTFAVAPKDSQDPMLDAAKAIQALGLMNDLSDVNYSELIASHHDMNPEKIGAVLLG